MNPRIGLLIAAGFLLIIGLAFGLTTVEAGPNVVEPTNCGSPLMPDDDEARERDKRVGGGNVDACDSARGKRAPVTYGALGLGVVAGLMAIVVPTKKD